MQGPKPKSPATRQRRNKSASAAVLPTGALGDAPTLPKGRRWRAETKAWWADVWASPMASQFLQADVHALRRLAVLVNAFWVAPSTSMAGEIREQEARFGLTPLDRWRLQWKFDDEPTKPAVKYQEDGVDPRTKLRVVK